MKNIMRIPGIKELRGILCFISRSALSSLQKQINQPLRFLRYNCPIYSFLSFNADSVFHIAATAPELEFTTI